MRKFSIFNFKLSTQQGFTLIELLVVIGILGILASALVATIDPFEQLKKAQDANLKNVAVEFMNGSIRYYTTHNAMPWDSTSSGGGGCYTVGGGDASAVPLNTTTFTGCFDTLLNDNEIKAGFKTFSDLDKLLITEGSDQISICFNPKSSSGRKDKNTKYNSSGGEIAAGSSLYPCASQTSSGGSTSCYWCSK